jgi:hypothetical protein
MKMTMSPSKVPAVNVLASQVALTMYLISDPGNVDFEAMVPSSTAERNLSADSESSCTEVMRIWRIQNVYRTTVVEIRYAIESGGTSEAQNREEFKGSG